MPLIRQVLPPEKAIGVQEILGSDIMMAFDHCPPGQAERPLVIEALERTQLRLLLALGAASALDEAARSCEALPPARDTIR